ncbi:MAG: hypothetical protein ACI8W7_001556 [Gammaproteobacteria bacterium]|jgi:hypothetical protein
MFDGLISGDNHIDLTYCPADLWSAQAPAAWKHLVPRVQELDGDCHCFVEEQNKGTWNGVGGRGQHIWGADNLHPDCVWPDSRGHLERNLGELPADVRRKITYNNVNNLYALR